jgi:uncharacterized protein (DUF1499 family)
MKNLYSFVQQHGHLPPCPNTPNCVCSEAEGPRYIAPLSAHGRPERAWRLLGEVLEDMDGEIEQEEEDFLHARFRSKLFGFTDDVCCRLDRAGDCIQIRSSSRLGYWDLGVNRRRVEQVRQLFEKLLASSSP